MIYFLFRWLKGYVEFKFSGGFIEGFVNSLFETHVDVKNIRRVGDEIYARSSIGEYMKLHRVAFRHGGKVKVISRHGLPFIIEPFKNRYGLITGAFAFVLIVSFLSSFVWNVEIVGCNKVSESQIRECLISQGLKSGVMWSSFDKNDLPYGIMAEFDDVSWCYINRMGAIARVEINETVPKPKKIGLTDDNMNSVKRQEITLTIRRTKSVPTLSSVKEYKAICFYGVTFPLYLKKDKGKEYMEEKFLKINSRNVPVSVKKYTEKFYVYTDYEMSDSRLINLSKSRLAAVEKERFSDCEIINSTVKTKLSDENCIITGSYVVKY